MKIKVSSSYSGKLNVGDYSNLQPFFSAELEYDLAEGENALEKIAELQKTLHHQNKSQFDAVAEMVKLEKIKRDRADFRWYPLPDGREVPSSTSILNYDSDFAMPEEELKQYASQGTIIHKQIEVFIETGEWKEPGAIPELAPHIFIIKKGALGLSLDGWDFEGFVKKFGLTDLRVGKPGVNAQYEYGGTPDFFCQYEGKTTLVDVKRTPDKTKNFTQIASYARLENVSGVEQMMICVINDKTERGYSKPIVETRIDHYFEMFLFKRKAFRTVYGV